MTMQSITQEANQTSRPGQTIYDAAWGKLYPTSKGKYNNLHFKCYHLKDPVIEVYQNKLEKTVLIRSEYKSIYHALDLSTNPSEISEADKPRRFVITGQPGIGKTTFLIYILIQRLQKKQPTSLEIDPQRFLLFDDTGVRMLPTDANSAAIIPADAWALCDSSEASPTPCLAFLGSQAVIVQASSPQSSRWKQWVKKHSAEKWVMDVWTLDELGALLTLLKLDVSRGLELARKWGPCANTVISIIRQEGRSQNPHPRAEEDHRKTVVTAAQTIAATLAPSLEAFQSLDFSGPNSPSVIFIKSVSHRNHKKAFTYIPTLEIASILSVALLSADPASQIEFFALMSRHAYSRIAAGWIFANYMHARFTMPDDTGVVAFDEGNNPHTIPTVSNIVSNTLDGPPPELATIPFYWQMGQGTFPGISAIVCAETGHWVLHASITPNRSESDVSTISSTLFPLVFMTPRTKPWHLVFISPTLESAQILQEEAIATISSGTVAAANIWACELQLSDLSAQSLVTIMDDAGDPLDPEMLDAIDDF